MIRWAYDHIGTFRKAVNRINFSEQKKPDGFANLTFCITDSQGSRYYDYPDESYLPLIRKGKLDNFNTWLAAGLTQPELNSFLDVLEKNSEKMFKAGKLLEREHSENRYLMGELRKRKDVVVHPELFIDIVACVLIREDERPEIFDEQIHTEKREQFKRDMKSGLYAFFFARNWTEYLPYTNISKEALMESLKISEGITETQMQIIGHLLSKADLNSPKMEG